MKHLVMGLAACAALAATPALAQDCHSLQTISSVTLQPSETRLKEYVPVKINGAAKKLVLDTGGYTTQVTQSVADELKLPIGGSLGGLKYIGGSTMAVRSATIASFEMGSMRARDISVLVSPIPGLENLADGLLASDMFLAYDIDMDFGGNKLNFISPEHCPGKVLYWQAAVVAQVPLRIVGGHYLIDIMLDGHRMVAMLDTGASRTSIGMAQAHTFFGLSADSPGMETAQKANGLVTTYTHKFDQLSFDGVEIHTPTIAVMNSSLFDRQRPSNGAAIIGAGAQPWDMILGMDMMRHLHVYIATQERKVYITPA